MAVELQGEREASSTEVAYWRSRYEDERRKLAMLWKAFEDLEARLAALEDRRSPAPATVVRVTPPAAEAPKVIEVVREVPAPEQGLQPVPRYPVGLYKLARVPGIATAEVEQLRNYGINLTDELLHADLDKLAEATGLAKERLQRYRDICELMAINGIGAKWAEELVDAEVTTIKQLAGLSGEELYRLLMARHTAKGTPEKERVLMERTLPARAKKLVNAAKKAAKSL